MAVFPKCRLFPQPVRRRLSVSRLHMPFLHALALRQGSRQLAVHPSTTIDVFRNLENVGNILLSRGESDGICHPPDGNIASALDVSVTEATCSVTITGAPARALLSCSSSWLSGCLPPPLTRTWSGSARESLRRSGIYGSWIHGQCAGRVLEMTFNTKV
jgi:hypothetical protein